ncbi:hypothetical protein P3T23_008606 [Paraburkholderia sp. GAS448]|jgi:hypothetical protein
MAKGQLRSNREAKKPKQPKKATPASGPLSANPIKVAPRLSETEKKR